MERLYDKINHFSSKLSDYTQLLGTYYVNLGLDVAREDVGNGFEVPDFSLFWLYLRVACTNFNKVDPGQDVPFLQVQLTTQFFVLSPAKTIRNGSGIVPSRNKCTYTTTLFLWKFSEYQVCTKKLI